jgi:hypothetical protein
MKPITWIIVGVVVAVIALMAYSTTSLGGFRVEICKTFQGREACGTAAGTTEMEAMNTATQVACAKISSGMTDSHNCQVSNPIKVNWLKRR